MGSEMCIRDRQHVSIGLGFPHMFSGAAKAVSFGEPSAFGAELGHNLVLVGDGFFIRHRDWDWNQSRGLANEFVDCLCIRVIVSESTGGELGIKGDSGGGSLGLVSLGLLLIQWEHRILHHVTPCSTSTTLAIVLPIVGSTGLAAGPTAATS